MTYEALTELVQDFASRLGEHFDSVQILVSWVENGVSKHIPRGVGDWYARQGMAHSFINTDIAQDTAFQIAEKLNERPEDGDEWKESV